MFLKNSTRSTEKLLFLPLECKTTNSLELTLKLFSLMINTIVSLVKKNIMDMLMVIYMLKVTILFNTGTKDKICPTYGTQKMLKPLIVTIKTKTESS